MFSSNIGFRRRTHSDGSNQLYQNPPSTNRTSTPSHRHSLDESSSTATKRVVLRKYSGESTGTRGLAHRIACSEVENIGGFWSRRLSGQKRSAPSSPRQTESNIPEWRMEAKSRDETSWSTAGKGKEKAKPSPRPLPIPPATPPTQTLYPPLIPPLTLTPSLSEILPQVTVVPPLIPKEPVALLQTPVPPQLPTPSSQPLTKTKVNKSSNPSTTDLVRDGGAPYRSLPPMPLSLTKSSSNPKTKSKREDKEFVKEKEKKRFAHFEFTLGKLVAGTVGYKKPASHSTMVTIFSEHSTTLVSPNSLSVVSTASIPVPPIPASASLPPIYRARAHAVQISRQSVSLRRKSTRKRKTGLARIVVELAKGGQVAAVDAEAIQEAAEVRDILAQLRQMKAA